MSGTYYLMQTVVEAKAGTVVMVGSHCALGHGFRISDDPFPIQNLPIDGRIPPMSRTPTAIPSWLARNCWHPIPGPSASART